MLYLISFPFQSTDSKVNTAEAEERVLFDTEAPDGINKRHCIIKFALNFQLLHTVLQHMSESKEDG